MRRLVFSRKHLQLIDAALRHAIDDVECYLKDGTPEQDYMGNEKDLEALRKMPDQWLELRRIILAAEQFENG